MDKEKRKSKHPLLIIAMLFMIAPLGLYWMYREERWPNLLKYGISVAYVICVTAIFLENS